MVDNVTQPHPNEKSDSQVMQLFSHLYKQIDNVYSHFADASDNCEALTEKEYFALEDRLHHIEEAGDSLCRSLFGSQLPEGFGENMQDTTDPDDHMANLLASIENYGKFCKTMAASGPSS